MYEILRIHRDIIIHAIPQGVRWRVMGKIWNALITIDIWINVKVFRGQKETMSDRMGENLLEKDYGCCKWRMVVCKILSWLDPRKGNHCVEAIEKID